MKKIRKRLMSLLLAATMMFSPVMPVQAAVDDDITYNKVTYYNVDSNNFDVNSKLFFQDLLSGSTDSKKNNNIAAFWQSFGFEVMKLHGRGTSTEKFRTQMNSVMSNGLAVKIGSGASYNKDHSNDDNTYKVYSQGLTYADSAKAAGEAMEAKVYQGYGLAEGERSKSDAVQENGTLAGDSKSTPTYWMVTGAFKTSGSNKKGHYQALGVVFSDFKITPILPEDDGDFYQVTTTETSSDDYENASVVENQSGEFITASKELTKTTTTTATSTINGSEQYGFEESISVTAEANIPLMGSLSTSVGFTATQVIESGWSESKSKSETTSSTDTVSITLPAYTSAMIIQSTAEETTKTDYDCPVALSFSVTIVEYTLDPSSNDAEAKSKRLAYFGANAQKDIYTRGIVEKSLTDKEGLNWTQLHKKSEYTEKIASIVPMSYEGAIFTVNRKVVTSKVTDPAPLYSLSDIRIAGDVMEYNMDIDEYMYTDSIKLEGLNAKGGLYYWFNSANGHWVVTDEKGNEITDSEIAKIEKDPVNGRTRLVAGDTEGAVYLKYIIDEDCYGTAANPKGYATNDTLNSTVIVKVNIKKEEVTPEPIKMPFEDVTQADWFYNAVYYNFVKGLMTGKNNLTFAPNETLTRAQFASILYRINGAPDVEFEAVFPDVTEDAWYADAIVWAYNAGVISGYSDGRFGPDDTVTREQMAIMMYNYAKAQNFDVSASADLGKFEDSADVSWYAEDEVKWAVGSTIISGKDNGRLLDPIGPTARAECATIIQNYMEAYVE